MRVARRKAARCTRATCGMSASTKGRMQSVWRKTNGDESTANVCGCHDCAGRRKQVACGLGERGGGFTGRPGRAAELRSGVVGRGVGVHRGPFANRPEILDPLDAFEEVEFGGALSRREVDRARERNLPQVDAAGPRTVVAGEVVPPPSADRQPVEDRDRFACRSRCGSSGGVHRRGAAESHGDESGVLEDYRERSRRPGLASGHARAR